MGTIERFEELLVKTRETIDELEGKLARLEEEKGRMVAQEDPNTLEFQIHLATLRLGIRSTEQLIHTNVQRLGTIQQAMEREDKNDEARQPV